MEQSVALKMNTSPPRRKEPRIKGSDCAREESQARTHAEAHWEHLKVCFRATQALGLPRFVAETFGFLFCDSAPTAIQEVEDGLELHQNGGLEQLAR